MEKELQSKLAEILGSIQTAAGKASDFALSELPDIAQSYIAFGRASSLVWLLLSLCAVAGGVWLLRRAIAEEEKEYPKKNDFVTIMCGAGGILGLVGGTVTFFAGINNVMMVWFAPKVWLLTKLAALIK